MNRPTSEKRRGEILEAALDCFAERGYAATTLDDIRARSGASTGSIYHFFSGKEQLGGALYLEGLRAWQSGFLKELDAYAHESAESMVRAAVASYLRFVAGTPRVSRFMLHTRQTELLPSVRDEVKAMNRAFFREIQRLLQPHLPKLRPLPLELFTAVVMGPAHEYARQWLAGQSKLSPEEARPHLEDAAWAAVKAPGARQKQAQTQRQKQRTGDRRQATGDGR